ncbi:unnamed protein product [Arctogadus glacialis]
MKPFIRCVGFAVDEFTDVSDNAQLLIHLRFFNQEKKEFCEDVLGVPPLKTSSIGEDIYLAIRYLNSWQDKLELSSLTEKQKVGELDRRGKEREAKTVQLLRCVDICF